MSVKLQLAPNLALPPDVITQTLGVLAMRGAGKSNLAAVLGELESIADRTVEAINLVSSLRRELDGAWQAAKETVESARAMAARSRTTGPAIPVANQLHRAAPARTVTPRPPEIPGKRGGGSLGRGERLVLIAIAQHDAGVTREQLTVLTGYKRSSRDTYLQKLSSRGLIELGETITATDAGVAELGNDFEPLPRGDALLEHWLGRLPQGERVVLEVIVRHHPRGVDKDVLSEQTGYKRSSRDTYLQKLAARQLVHVDRGSVKASEELFG